MKKVSLVFPCLFCLVLFALSAQCVLAQQNSPAKWMRVQSDDGEFSIEVPADYGFFADKKGFSIGINSKNYELKEMNMLNTYVGRTLVSVECYTAKKGAADAIRESETVRGTKNSDIKQPGYAGKQTTYKTDEAYVVRRYIASKNRVYVLTAASRDGETPEMKRFFDSLAFSPADSKKAQATLRTDAIPFSKLKAANIEIDANPEPLTNKPPVPQAAKAAADDNSKRLLILSKPRASYTNQARDSVTTGVVQMRITFSERGFISKIGVLKTLPDDLTWQCVFAALRIKFLPAEKDGAPVAAKVIIEYSFSIY